jgi:hypothetical protein
LKGKAYLALLALVMGHAAIGKLLGLVVMPKPNEQCHQRQQQKAAKRGDPPSEAKPMTCW